MSKLLKILFMLAYLISPVLGSLYTMKDLSVLAEEKNHSEFFSHALDIPPSKRDQAWKNMVETLGIDHLNILLAKTQLAEKDYRLVHQLSNWPIFKEDEFFIKKRDYIFLRELKTCFSIANNNKDRRKCVFLSKKVFNDYNHDQIFSYDIVLALKPHNIGHVLLWEFASKLVGEPISEFYCGKPVLKDIIIDQLYINFSKTQAFELPIHKDCLRSLSPHLTKLLIDKDKNLRHVAFNFLKNKSLLDEKSKNQFHILNFLENTNLQPSDIDQSLLAFKAISESISERESLLANLSKLEVLPEGVFSNSVKDSAKEDQARTRIINRYFPEYILHYAKTCLSYLKADGQNLFPNGNPTPGCHNFFKNESIAELLPKNYFNDYEKATFFVKK